MIRSTAQELLLSATARGATVEFHGPTMEPFIEDGDLLTTRPTSRTDLRRGDIVTVRLADQFPTCRLIALGGDRALLTADAWPDFHLSLSCGDILAKVVGRTRGGRTLDPRSWTWRFHTARALALEAIRSRSAVVRRKRTQFKFSA